VTADIVYGRRPVRELLRVNREALEIWATERALSAEPWLRDAAVRVTVKPERELTALAGVREHQGVVPARTLSLCRHENRRPSPLLVCLDQSRPRNLEQSPQREGPGRGSSSPARVGGSRRRLQTGRRGQAGGRRATSPLPGRIKALALGCAAAADAPASL
jgi:hypothetical protein